MVTREVAKRIFAYELLSSIVSYKEDENDRYSPVYVLTATGEKCSRVFIVGSITSKETVGNGDVRMKINDGTAQIYVYIGNFNSAAITAASSMNPGDYVAIVGKPVIYRLSNGDQFVYVKATDVNRVDEDTYRHWMAEAALHTYHRLTSIHIDSDRAKIARELYNVNEKEYLALCKNVIH